MTFLKIFLNHNFTVYEIYVVCKCDYNAICKHYTVYAWIIFIYLMRIFRCCTMEVQVRKYWLSEPSIIKDNTDIRVYHSPISHYKGSTHLSSFLQRG